MCVCCVKCSEPNNNSNNSSSIAQLTLDGGAFGIQGIVHQFLDDARQIGNGLFGRDAANRIRIQALDFRRLRQGILLRLLRIHCSRAEVRSATKRMILYGMARFELARYDRSTLSIACRATDRNGNCTTLSLPHTGGVSPLRDAVVPARISAAVTNRLFVG